MTPNQPARVALALPAGEAGKPPKSDWPAVARLIQQAVAEGRHGPATFLCDKCRKILPGGPWDIRGRRELCRACVEG
jgi:hypothetical protein